jgi:hypothetical protein
MIVVAMYLLRGNFTTDACSGDNHPGATTSAVLSLGEDGCSGATHTAHAKSAARGQSRLSSELHIRSSSSNLLQSTDPLGEGARTAPVDANTGGLSVGLPGSLSPVHSHHPLSGEALRRLSESLPQSVQMSASPDAFGDSSWHQVGLQLAGKFYADLEWAACMQASA